MQVDSSKFQSFFRLNGVPIMPPVITKKLRDEIKQIRELVRELSSLKEDKDRKNMELLSSRSEDDRSQMKRRNSYTLSSPIFTSDLLPKISAESTESMNTVIDGTISMQSIEVDENAADKSSKDLRNETDKRSTTLSSSVYNSSIEPQVNNHLRELIEKQKQEYLNAMETLKKKFTNEQHELLVNLESNVLVTSTPLNSSMAPSVATDDDDFIEFKTCLQIQSTSREEKTIGNDQDAQIIASSIINSYARGFLTRRLIKTIYVQEHIRNIKETLQLVLNLSDHNGGNSPVHYKAVLMKAKLFRQLQNDLYNFNEIFNQYSVKERMKIIASDRDIRTKKANETNKGESFKDFV